MNLLLNKNAFQSDAYRPLQWPSGGGGERGGGVGVWSAYGVSAREGVCGGGAEVSARPPLNRITDRCQNITLPQLRCGRF